MMTETPTPAPMDAATYQREAARTLIDDSAVQPLTARQHRIVWNALGLAGEAGEVLTLTPHASAIDLSKSASLLCERVKKQIFHEQGLDVPTLHWTLGGVLICVAQCWQAHSQRRNAPELLKELGDVCWYTSALCSNLELSLAELVGLMPAYADVLAPIFAANIAKLRVRFPAGWDVADAAARVDVEAPDGPTV